MSIEDEIWNEFNDLSGGDYRPRKFREINEDMGFGYGEKIGTIARIDNPQFLWRSRTDIHTDELIEKVIRGEKKWDQIVDDLPKRIVPDPIFHEKKLNNLLLSVFHTENDAYNYMLIKRWPHNVDCPKCNGTIVYSLNDGRYKCGPCNYKFSATAKTMFHNTKLDLVQWYGGIMLLLSGKKIGSPKLGSILRMHQTHAYYMAKKIKANINDPFLREINHGLFEYKSDKFNPPISLPEIDLGLQTHTK